MRCHAEVAKKEGAMSTTTTETKPTTALDWAGIGSAVLAVLALATPLGYTFLGGPNVTLNSQDQIRQLLSNGVIATIASAVFGLLGSGFSVPGLMKVRTGGRITTTSISGLVLIGALVFLLVALLPRVNAIQNLNDKIQPFAVSLRDNCQTPLQQTKAELKDTKLDADRLIGDDNAFAAAMQRHLQTFRDLADQLTAGAAKLSTLKSPDSKYNDLLSHCTTDVQAEAAFLTSHSAIPLPAPFNAISPSVSLEELLDGSTLLATGKTPLGALPTGTAQAGVSAVLQQAIATDDPTLTQEGDQLSSDIKDTLTNNLSPFKVDTNAIVGQ
jgi:hypothetical protein